MDLKLPISSSSLISSGKLFHRTDPDTEKARSPYFVMHLPYWAKVYFPPQIGFDIKNLDPTYCRRVERYALITLYIDDTLTICSQTQTRDLRHNVLPAHLKIGQVHYVPQRENNTPRQRGQKKSIRHIIL